MIVGLLLAAAAAHIVLPVPAAQIVYPAVWQALEGQYPAMRSERWNLNGPKERLDKLVMKYDIRIVDVQDAFVQHREPEPLFFGLVGHMTAAGHVVMAGALESAIEGLISARTH